MNASHSSYDHEEGSERIKEILNSSENNYVEVNEIPSRDRLTFTNGFYVNCGVMFVDMRGSSKLPDKYKRPTLARIYRSYISELVAVFRDHQKVAEVKIEGDCVWGVYDCPTKDKIDELFSVSAKVSSVVEIMNWRLEKKGIDTIRVGIGLDYGRALMIKSGYKGSSINDVVWMGGVVNQASKLCAMASRDYSSRRLMVSTVFQQNLNDDNKKLLAWNYQTNCYHGDIVNVSMDTWLKEQKAK